MAPSRTLRKRSHSQSPSASGLHVTAVSAPYPLSNHCPTITTYLHPPSNPVGSPVPDHKSASPFDGVTNGMQVDPLGTRARGRKRGKDGQEIWPVHLEEVFLQGLIEYEDLNPPCDELGVDKRRWEHRNHWLSDYIFQKTGILRRRKQVGSRMQTLKKSWDGTPRYYLVCSPCERRRAMELKGRLEASHPSISDPRVVPGPAESLTARAHAQHSGDGCSVSTAQPLHPLSHSLSVFGSRPRPHQLAFLLWDGMRHVCLLRHSDLCPSSTKSLVGVGPTFASLATPHPVVIQVPTERLASELCLPFGGEYYPSGSGVVITVFVDNEDAPLHRSQYYLDGRDSNTVKVDFANCVIRVLCMENFLEDRFRCPGTEGEVLTIIAEVIHDLCSPQRQLIQVLLFQFQAVQPAPSMTTPPLVVASSAINQPTSHHDLAISSLPGSVCQEHLIPYSDDPSCIRSDPYTPWHYLTPTSPSSVSTTSLGDMSFATNLTWLRNTSSPKSTLPTSRSRPSQEVDTLMETTIDLSFINSPYLYPELSAPFAPSNSEISSVPGSLAQAF